MAKLRAEFSRLVEEGRIKEAVELGLELFWRPLFEVVERTARRTEENARAISELRERTEENAKAIAELRKHTEGNARAIAELRERTEENAKAIAELRASISELKERTQENAEAIKELRASIAERGKHTRENLRAIAELRASIAELKTRTHENLKAIAELRASLEAEIAARKGEAGRLEGLITHTRLILGLMSWCEAYGLRLEELPARPYRVDAAIEGRRVLALVEIAKTGEEADVRQLLEGARTYERLRGERPNALVLYIYAERPPEELVKACEEQGIIVENSPKRIAARLAELEERWARA